MQLAQLSYLTRQHGFAFATSMLVRSVQQIVLRSQGRPHNADVSLIQKRFKALLQRDWENAEAGDYPRELLFDTEPLKTLAKTLPLLAAQLPDVVRRMRGHKVDELPADVDRSRYPDYYLRTFHWQTDGWFSRKSARLYDPSVDLLFGGTSDVMRRQALPAVVRATRSLPRPRILDVACGTGRFLRQMRSALPHAAITGLDLSPHYIAHARELLKDDGELSLVVDNAEALPFRDHSFDAVTSVFLFHELPKDARRNVIKEIARVLVPGGTVSICDSAQLIESEALAPFLGSFQASYHEPYYKSYIRDPLERLVEDAGLVMQSSEPHLVSKVVVAKKPLAR